MNLGQPSREVKCVFLLENVDKKLPKSTCLEIIGNWCINNTLVYFISRDIGEACLLSSSVEAKV